VLHDFTSLNIGTAKQTTSGTTPRVYRRWDKKTLGLWTMFLAHLSGILIEEKENADDLPFLANASS
jgi:hypothetical protein